MLGLYCILHRLNEAGYLVRLIGFWNNAMLREDLWLRYWKAKVLFRSGTHH